ncbi:hypothetical protein C0Q70_06803 [Pomacea canaliculata]|uniref:Nuclear speckle splicing regulatory protein 1 N-terminal domain-containing protein n=1 Tax=Pomacea canaliculata TaxID=400727 RepID=A0A2T7PDB0_POMCA|nr:hypothetical protein C0Q70_06803 [Pomacea canaliculata]
MDSPKVITIIPNSDSNVSIPCGSSRPRTRMGLVDQHGESDKQGQQSAEQSDGEGCTRQTVTDHEFKHARSSANCVQNGEIIYGLFIPKKTGRGAMLTQATKRNVFGDDSDEESSNIPKSGTSKKVTTDLAKVKKQTQLEIDKAILQDPTVYEYDAVYDNIQAEKIKSDVKEKNKQDRKADSQGFVSVSQIHHSLLKMAEVRKREEERRTERKVQKEREEEGNQFADKEAFVTSAYKKKMLEQEEAEEKEKKEAALEAMLDVTKQKDLSGFYRYLYRETTGKETTTEKHDEFKVKLEPKSDRESDDSTDSSVQRENEKEKASKEEKKKTTSTAKLTREDPDTDGESDRPTDFSSSKDKLVQTKSPPEDLDRDDSLSESDSSEEEVGVQEETTSMSGRKQPFSAKDGDGQKAQTEKTGESKVEKSQLKYARHTSDEGVSDARKRFLARKLAKERATAVDAEYGECSTQ